MGILDFGLNRLVEPADSKCLLYLCCAAHLPVRFGGTLAHLLYLYAIATVLVELRSFASIVFVLLDALPACDVSVEFEFMVTDTPSLSSAFYFLRFFVVTTHSNFFPVEPTGIFFL